MIKSHLGLDAARSWVVINESNLFAWPGPDLRRIANDADSSVAYGLLPPRFFNEIRRKFLESEQEVALNRIQRTD